MGPPDLGLPLTCPCQTCVTWRRLGEVIRQGHPRGDFHVSGLGVLRLAFNDLLDLGNPPGHSLPVAAGGLGSARVGSAPPGLPVGGVVEPGAGGAPAPLPPAREVSQKKEDKKKRDKSTDRSRRRRRRKEEEEAEDKKAVSSTPRSSRASDRSRTKVKEESPSPERSPSEKPEEKSEENKKDSRSRSPASKSKPSKAQ